MQKDPQKQSLENHKFTIKQETCWKNIIIKLDTTQPREEIYELDKISLHSSNKTILKKLIEEGITNIKQIVEINNKLLEYPQFKEIIDKDNKKLFNQMKKEFEEKDKIKPFISTRLNHNIREEFKPENFFYDDEYKGFEVYVDETMKKTKGKPDKAGYGIHFRRKHKYNFYDRVDGEQTLKMPHIKEYYMF